MEVAGIFLGREGGLLLHASIIQKVRENKNTVDINDPWEIECLEGMKVEWSKNEPKKAKQGIRKLARFIKNRPNIESVAVASYGPFQSLTYGKDDYGSIHAKRAHMPLRDFNLKEIFTDIIGDKLIDKKAPKLIFHTDASACALGEAYERKIKSDEMLGFIYVTDGIGLGIVKGRNIVTSALHSEIGLMAVRLISEDPLMPKEEDKPNSKNPIESPKNKVKAQYSGSLEELAANGSIEKRMPNLPLEEIWIIRAYYLAQACLSYVTVFPPHYIVIGADIDPENNIGEKVHEAFKLFFDSRKDKHQPVFKYKELEHKDFISCSSNTDGQYISANGVIGMCYAAASSLDRGRVTDINRISSS